LAHRNREYGVCEEFWWDTEQGFVNGDIGVAFDLIVHVALMKATNDCFDGCQTLRREIKDRYSGAEP
jgi:hypothetical protein